MTTKKTKNTYPTPMELVDRNPKSRAGLMKANCLECENGTRGGVRDCTCVNCPFWHIRPWRKKAIDLVIITEMLEKNNECIKTHAQRQLKYIQTGSFV